MNSSSILRVAIAAFGLAILCGGAFAHGRTKEEYLIRGLPARDVLGIRPAPPHYHSRFAPEVDGLVILKTSPSGTKVAADANADGPGDLKLRTLALYQGDRARELPDSMLSIRPRHAARRATSADPAPASHSLMVALAGGSILLVAALWARRRFRAVPENQLSPATVCRQRGLQSAWNRKH